MKVHVYFENAHHNEAMSGFHGGSAHSKDGDEDHQTSGCDRKWKQNVVVRVVQHAWKVVTDNIQPCCNSDENKSQDLKKNANYIDKRTATNSLALGS